MNNVTINKREIITALEMALAFVIPIWGGLYMIAVVFG